MQSRRRVGASLAYLGHSRRLARSKRRSVAVYISISVYLDCSLGLVSYGDYVIGYSGGVLRGEGDFYTLIEEHIERPLRLFVYNSDFDVTREVVIGALRRIFGSVFVLIRRILQCLIEIGATEKVC